MGERLDKFLASQGLGTRKEVGKLIRSGAVLVNGAPQRDPRRQSRARRRPGDSTGGGNPLPGIPHHHAEQAGGSPLRHRGPPPENRAGPAPGGPAPAGGLFPAGRLDKDTTGLLLITDDGELAHKMLSPKNHVYKQYRAQLDAPVEEAGHPGLCRWRRLGGGAVRPRPPVGGAGPPRRLCGDPGGPFPPGQADVPGPGQDGAPAEKAQDRGPLAGQYTTGRGVQASYPPGNPGNFPLASCTKN